MAFARIQDLQTGQPMTLMSTQVIGTISNAIASLRITQRFINRGREGGCRMLMSKTDGYVIYDIDVVKGHQQVTFNIHEFEDKYMTRVGQYNTMAFQASVNDTDLILGEVKPNDIVQVSYGVSFSGSLDSANTIRFALPHNEAHNETSAFMELRVENTHGVQQVTLPGYDSEYTGGVLRVKKVTLTAQPVVLVQTLAAIESAGLARMINNDLLLTLELTPKDLPKQTAAAEIFFLLDISGSMGGTKIRNAVDALISMVTQLATSNYFNIVVFESDFTGFYEESQQANKANLDNAVQRLRATKAGGGTNLLSPLEFVYRKPPRPGFVRQLFILTDGQVSQEAEILHLIATHRGDHRIFSLGIGGDVARAFIEEVATKTGGSAAFVDPRDIQAAVAVQLAASGSPAVVNVQIHVGDDEGIEMTPFPVSPLFQNRITQVFLRRKNAKAIPTAILVTGQIVGEQFEQSFEVTPTDAPVEMLKLFAFFNIKDMASRIPVVHGAEADALRANVVQMSKDAHLISVFTAMFTMVDGVELHLQPSFGQERFACGMQGFTQDQCRGQERFRAMQHFGPP
jgi:Mg-chelatase subunit ChlD